jgi:hypothetical protein
LPKISSDLTGLFRKREIFWDLQEIAKENPKVLSPGAFFDWMCKNYITAVTVSIRALMDQSSDVHSLWRMLYEILEHPGIISRRSHVSLYRTAPKELDLGNKTFDTVVGRSKQYLPNGMIRADLRKLEDASARVRRFVNKRVVHRTSPGEIRKIPKFAELDEVIDVLDRIFCKYDLLLTAAGTMSTRVERNNDWRRVLHTPWIEIGSKFRPKA